MAGRPSAAVTEAVRDYRTSLRLFVQPARERPYYLLDTEAKVAWAKALGDDKVRLGDLVQYKPRRPTVNELCELRAEVAKRHKIHRTTLWRALRGNRGNSRR